LHLHLNDLERLRESFAQREGGSVVITSDLPSGEMSAFVVESKLPIIVFGDDLGDAFHWVRTSRVLAAVDAARFCSRMLSALSPAFLSRRALIIPRRNAASPHAIVSQIIGYLFPGRAKTLVDLTFQHLIEADHIKQMQTVEDSDYHTYDSTSPDLLAKSVEPLHSARDAVMAYDGLCWGRPVQEIVWPMELFTRLDGRPARAPVELTGPARALFWGPYMHLPAGDWTARVEFEIDGALSGVEAMTDVIVNEVVNEKTFEMPAKGIFAYDLSFHVANPHLPVEIRLFTKRSAIEGVFLPRSVRVRPGLSRS
jgi:hypothetical protein